MKRSAVLLAVVTIFIANSISMAIEDVYFPDANLEASVRLEVDDRPSYPVTYQDMLTLWYFFAIEKNISNLSGLDYAANLIQLCLDRNQISDISPLSPLTKMRHLYLDENQISDISAVSSMSELTFLYLEKNQLSDISPVSSLESIKVLNLKSNQISDISAVSGLTTLEELYFRHNQISDISAVSNLTNLNKLELGNNQVSDISPVSTLTNTPYLYLDHNRISDTLPITGLSNLKYVGLNDNNIDTLDLSASELVSLTHFEIRDNPVTSVILKDAMLNQNRTFYALMVGGGDGNTGIAEVGGVLKLDMSGVDFGGISHLLYVMHGMDDLEELFLVEATNLDGSHLAQLIEELDSLNYLNLTGTWNTFDTVTQVSLNSWDVLEGNILVVPEPTTLMLVAIGGLVMIRRRKIFDNTRHTVLVNHSQ